MIAFDPSSSTEENLDAMDAAMSGVSSMSVTHAVRSTTIDGEKIKSGQIIGMLNNSINCVANSIPECISKLSDKMISPSYITLFYGSDVNEKDALAVETVIKEKHPSAEIATINGGHPLYEYIISVE